MLCKKVLLQKFVEKEYYIWQSLKKITDPPYSTVAWKCESLIVLKTFMKRAYTDGSQERKMPKPTCLYCV